MFTVWGAVGLRSPVCMRCAEPNPRPLADSEWAELVSIETAGTVGITFGGHLGAAIRARMAA